MKAKTRSTVKIILFNLGARWKCVDNATLRSLYLREREPVPIVQEAGWAPLPVWTGAENLSPTGIRSPDSPARSESLYRLRYSSTQNTRYAYIILVQQPKGKRQLGRHSLEERIILKCTLRLLGPNDTVCEIFGKFSGPDIRERVYHGVRLLCYTNFCF